MPRLQIRAPPPGVAYRNRHSRCHIIGLEIFRDLAVPHTLSLRPLPRTMTKDTRTQYQQLESLPFADGTFATTPKFTETTRFNLVKDGRSVTLVPAHSPQDLPSGLVDVLHDEFNHIVDEGRTYPHYKTMNREEFLEYAFECFTAVLVDGDFETLDPNQSKEFWQEKYLGHFYIKPNYIGRCSHVCNAGFIVNHHKRGLGLGSELGKKYLYIAPKLGFVYSVFNLVFETNVASVKIWDSLGFDRIGYIKNVAVLKGETTLTGAIMFGKDLN